VQAQIESASAARVDYVAIVDGETLQAIPTTNPHALLAVAVFFGQTRLIDNIRLG